MPKTRFGKLIAVMLIEKERTRKDLISATRIAGSTLSGYYTGYRSVSQSNLDKICRYFITLGYTEESMTQLYDAAKELQNRYYIQINSELDAVLLATLKAKLPDLKDGQKQRLIDLLTTFHP